MTPPRRSLFSRPYVRGPIVAFFLAAGIAWLLWGRPSSELPALGQVPAFSLTDQTGARVDSKELAGKVWVVDFMFTRCSMVCPRLTNEMMKLQQHLLLEGLDPEVRLVSITVDPEHDTPEVLAGYARRYQAQPNLWKLLGGDAKAVERAVVDGFHELMEPAGDGGADDSFDILHSSKMVLVDQKGTIRGYYDATSAEEMARLRDDLHRLARRGLF